MSGSEIVQAIKPVVRQFERLQIVYYVGGSVASSVYGVARTTLDADLIAVMAEPHVDRFVDALRDDYYVSSPMIRTAIKTASSFNVIHLATMFKVDVFIPTRRPFDQSVLGRIRKDSVGDDDSLEVFLASPEDLVLNKLEWYRMGDETSERQWRDVIGVLKVQVSNLDVRYLEGWAATLGVTGLLRRAIAEAGVG